MKASDRTVPRLDRSQPQFLPPTNAQQGTLWQQMMTLREANEIPQRAAKTRSACAHIATEFPELPGAVFDATALRPLLLIRDLLEKASASKPGHCWVLFVRRVLPAAREGGLGPWQCPAEVD